MALKGPLYYMGQRACNIARDAGWHDPKPDENGVVRGPSSVERIALIHSEVSEALEAWRIGMARTWTEVDGKPEGFGSELVDVIIRTVELAYILDIDLDPIFAQKMEYNTRRKDVPNKGGGKNI